MIRNIWRLIEKSGFAIFMISVVAVAIGWSQGFMPIVYIGLAIIVLGGGIVLFRANRAVSGRPKPRPSANGTATSATTATKRRPTSSNDPDLF